MAETCRSTTIEPLDIERPGALEAYLRSTGRVEPADELRSRPLAGGVSNRAVLVTRSAGKDWVIKQALPKLRVAVDWFSDPSRIEREAAGMRWLAELAPPATIPRLVFEDRQQHLLAMEAVPEPHENWKVVLLSGRVDRERVREFATLLATIHREAYRRRDEMAPRFADRSFFESLRLEPYYGFAAVQEPAAAAFLGALSDRTRHIADTLVHGDYSPKNILLSEGRMVLLDHEVVHWGDPAFDVGFSMTHLLSKAHHLAHCRRAFGEAAQHYWHQYGEALGQVTWRKDLEPRAVRHTLGCLLARVAGRSPLEYLGDEQRHRQRDVALALMRNPPSTVDELIDRFLTQL
jgi:aminoglycoside phosphotransferase (APT) family kinase protein